jgi:hypothetical protein
MRDANLAKLRAEAQCASFDRGPRSKRAFSSVRLMVVRRVQNPFRAVQQSTRRTDAVADAGWRKGRN